MTIPTVQEVRDFKTDIDAAEEYVNSTETTFDTRLGGTKDTITGILSKSSQGAVTTYSAATTYTDIDEWVEESGIVYRPLPSALPIGPESFDSDNWIVAQDFTYSTFNSVATMKSYTGARAEVGKFLYTTDYYSTSRGGGGKYLVKTTAQASSDGDTIDEKGNHTLASGNVAILQPEGKVYAEQYGALNVADSAGFDSLAAVEAAMDEHNIVYFQYAKTYAFGSKLTFPGNAHQLIGAHNAPFSSNTTIQPVDDTFSDDCLIDLNESGSESGTEGGQFNYLKNITVRGGMTDYTDAADALVDLVGVKFKNTRETCGMFDVSFRACGIPFHGTGYIHWLQRIYVYQCHEGPVLSSTNSSSIDTYVIQTCSKNWGSLHNCNVHNATIQQGNEKQALDDDVGVTCTGAVHFTGYLYNEGGTKQIYVDTDATVSVENWEMGFCQRVSGSYGNQNAHVESGASLIVKGGKSVGTKSYLIGGDTTNALEIHLDIEPFDGRVIDALVELPPCKNLYVRRTYGTIRRVDHYNEITLDRYDIGTSTVTLWDQFSTSGSVPFGGTIEVQVGGSNSYDRYVVDFADGSSSTPVVNINTIIRNTGGTGDNNINLSYASGELTAEGRKSDQRISVKVNAYGSMWPVEIA